MTCRILIIEDDEPFELWTRQSLPGAEFIVVKSFAEALRHFAANRFDVVIVDISLMGPSLSENIQRLRVECARSNAALVGITGCIHELPKGFDAAEHKINLHRENAMQNLVFFAMRARDRQAPADRAADTVKTVAFLLANNSNQQPAAA